MKLAASRSLLQGTVGPFADRERGGDPVRLRHQLEVAVRQPEAALLDDRRGSAAAPRTCRSRPANRGPACSVRQTAATRSSIAVVAQVVARPGSGPRSRRRPARGARAGSRSTSGAAPLSAARRELTCSASRSMASRSPSELGEPDDHGAFRGRDLEVHVGQPALERLDLARRRPARARRPGWRAAGRSCPPTGPARRRRGQPSRQREPTGPAF